MANTPTLNLDVNEGAAYRKFIHHVRDTTGVPIIDLLPKDGFVVHPNSRRAAFIGEVDAKDWVSIVRLMDEGKPFDIAFQRLKGYVVGFKGPNKGWIVLAGEYRDRVIDCLNTSFPVLDEQGNLIPPYQSSLGTSYRSLRENGSGARKDLKLNRNALINAARGLTDAYSSIVSIDNSIPDEVPKFVLTLIQMISEAVRIEPQLSFICKNYTYDDLDTPKLPNSVIKMEDSWTRVSRSVAYTTYGIPFKEVCLKNGPLIRTREEAIAIFPFMKGIHLDELQTD